MGGHRFNPNAWDGYAASQDRIVAGLADSPVRNAVVLTGDVHSHWAAEVHERFDDPSSSVVATELVATRSAPAATGRTRATTSPRCWPRTLTFGTSTTVAPSLGRADVPADGEAVVQHEVGQDVRPVSECPRLDVESVVDEEGEVGRGLRGGA
jgi:phosphodiesterase/alkaline phosphatase D-like protein